MSGTVNSTPAEALKEARDSFSSVFASPNAGTLKLNSGKVLVSQGDDVESIYRVERGCVRHCIYTEEGHRHIIAFSGNGAVIGLEQPVGSQWNVAVEAVTSCIVTAVPRALVDRYISIDQKIREGAMLALQAEIELREAHLVLMAVLPAAERVHSLLESYARDRGSNGFVALPMCRRDIGDYIGLSMETVSRSFTALRETGRIELNGSEKFRLVQSPEHAGQTPRVAA